MDAPSPTRAGRVALVGRPNVGKSTLLNAMLGQHLAVTSHHPQTTRDRIVGVLTEREAQFVLIDTPGLHTPKTRLGIRMNREARGAIEGSDVIVFVTDVRQLPGDGVVEADLPLLASLPALSARPTVLVINKIDRLRDKALLLPVLKAYESLRDFAALVPLSAKKEAGARPLVAALRKLLPEGEKDYDEDTLTDRPARFLVAELVREQILKKTRAEVPHGVAVVVERFDESGKTVKIDLVVIVDKESHKKIVIGRAGALLKAIGTDARAKVERLLGRKVHLAIWVKVMPRWYESDARLVELGYGNADQTGGSP
jgi:GTP-binding protein Era